MEPLRQPTASSLIAGRYRIEQHLGTGGMGSVYRAIDETTGAAVALKWMDAGDPSRELRFRREFHSLASLEHPRIVKAFDYGVEDGGLYYTMELLEGEDLREVHSADGERRLSFRQLASVLRDIASALALLHSRRLVHRDLSHRNVRLGPSEEAKLFDFGVLANVGVIGEVAGTPPFIAPEVLRGLPVDSGSDLYALGALAYWLATGRHAYPARSIERLPDVWMERPVVPSKLSPDLPQGFDELVMALLSHDPLSRPSHAGEVIDRLTALAELEPAPEVETVRGYLASVPLVGRREELERLRKMVRRTVDGATQGVVVAAPSGQGKSRLIRELGLQAQLAGAKSAHANAGTGGGPYRLFRDVVLAIQAACPEEAARAARGHAAVAGHVAPELNEDAAPLAKLSGDPGEDRARIQSSLSQWLIDVAALTPLVLDVDDIQRADEASAAVLASAAQERGSEPLMLAFGLRTDEPVRAPAAIDTIRKALPQLTLTGLSQPDVELLVTSVLGEVEHATRLAEWLHRIGGGSPMHCLELLRYAVDRDVVRYKDGVWTVPARIELDDLPGQLTEAMDLRVRRLSGTARRLGQILSLVRGNVGLDLCLTLLPEGSEADVFAALDELGREGVIVQAESSVRFAHDGLREALARSLAEDARPEAHRQVASALAPHGRVSEEREAEVGWHLLAAGDRETAAKHLEAAGRRLCSAQSLGDAVEPLAAALEVYEEQDASAALRFDVRRMLVMAGVLGDIKTLRRYSEEALEATWHYAGLSVAARWGPRIGRPAALVLGLAVAGVRHLFTSRARRGPSPIDAFGFSLIVCSVLTTYLSTAFTDVQRLPQLLTRMRVFEAFKKQIPYGSLLACTNNLDVERGLYARARSRCAQSAEIVGTDRRTPITEDERKAALAMVHGQDCFTRLVVHDSEYEVALERLQGLGLVSVAFGANMYRALYHRMRGEEEQAQALFRKAEGERLRAGDGWIWNSQSAWVSTLAYAGTRDVLGLKRSIELLDRYIEDGFGFTAIRDLAEGEYRRTRGDLEGAREVLEPLLDRQDAPGFVVPNALAALAETYLLLGDTEKAKRAASMGSAVASAEDSGNVPVRLRCQVVLGLLEEGEGDSAAAVERLDRVVHEAEAQASPTLAGMAHEARARLASALDDADGVARHVAAMERWVRPTRNPALLQRLEQTQVLAGGVLPARQEGADETVTAEAQLQTVDPSQIAAAFRSARSVKERAEIALEALLRCTGGSHGFLFERNGRGLELLAPEHGQEPPTELRDSLDAIVRENDERAGGSRPSGPALKRAFHPVVLRDPDGGQCVAAAAIVPTADSRGLTPPPEVLQELARGLIEIAGLAG